MIGIPICSVNFQLVKNEGFEGKICDFDEAKGVLYLSMDPKHLERVNMRHFTYYSTLGDILDCFSMDDELRRELRSFGKFGMLKEDPKSNGCDTRVREVRPLEAPDGRYALGVNVTDSIGYGICD